MEEPGSSHWIIDRAEDGGWTVLEAPGGESVRLPSHWLPAEAGEGAVLLVQASGPSEAKAGTAASASVTFVVDEEETSRRRERLEELHGRIPRGPEGDVDL